MRVDPPRMLGGLSMDNEQKLQTTSPTPKESAIPATYLFSDALREVLNSRYVTRLAWGNEEVYGYMNKGVLCIEYGDSKYHEWIISEGDMTADDWIIL